MVMVEEERRSQGWAGLHSQFGTKPERIGLDGDNGRTAAISRSRAVVCHDREEVCAPGIRWAGRTFLVRLTRTVGWGIEQQPGELDAG